jgi:carbamoyltransferase
MPSTTTVLGISAYFHDAAACLVRDGEVVAAVQEERLSRVRNDRRFPRAAIRSCLEVAGVAAREVDVVAFYEKPHRKLERILASARFWYPLGADAFVAAMRSAGHTAWLPRRLAAELDTTLADGRRGGRWDGPVVYTAHHESHAASAYFPSPFDRAAILVVDGVGEWATTSIGAGARDARGVPRLRMLAEIRFPHSLGLLYSALTAFLGFEVNSDEYKVMGLAAYGRPRFAELLREHLVDLHPDGSFALNLQHFAFGWSPVMFAESLGPLLGMRPRSEHDPIEPGHADLAASLQVVLGEALLGLATRARELTGERRLCLAGGVALNSVANGLLLRSGLFDEIWIQPAAGDAGGALGAALHTWHEVLGERPAPRENGHDDGMRGALLGPSFGNEEVVAALERRRMRYERLDPQATVPRTAELLAAGRVVGWFQGRMEFGPRALGSRSILADPRPDDMQERLNARIKFREGFRPFAPIVLAEEASSWFGLDAPSPYMLLVAPVVRQEVPACTHVDGSARIQTVDRRHSPRLAALLGTFAGLTGVPVLVNTSFNLRGEPIVCTPDEALSTFERSEIDAVVLGDCIALREDQR